MYLPMPSDLSSPLLALLDQDASRDPGWLDSFAQACRDCIGQIDALKASMNHDDRDLQISLDAVRNCLDWATREPCTVDEAQALVVRVVEILRSVTALV
jgi:hypothetical protein